MELLEEDGKKSVIEYILKRFGVNVSSTSSKLDDFSVGDSVSFKGVAVHGKTSTIEEDQPQSTVTDIRTFADIKKPKSIVEQVALVAFYLLECANESEKTQEFSSEHIEKYFTQARFLSLGTRKNKIGKESYYINTRLFNLLKSS